MTDDPLQIVFDGTEAAQDALHYQRGCETALRMALNRLEPVDQDTGRAIWALVESIAHFRRTATTEVARAQRASMGRRQ